MRLPLDARQKPCHSVREVQVEALGNQAHQPTGTETTALKQRENEMTQSRRSQCKALSIDG